MGVDGPADSELELAGGVPDGFAGQVRDALLHLYDYAHLQRHPLARLAAVAARSGGGSAKALRDLLLDTIEQLHPGANVSPNDKEWRPYAILTRRYVDGFDIDDIIQELHISLRQFQREHRKGLLAVANMLWQRWQASGLEAGEGVVSPGGAAAGADGQGLRQEVQRLGVLPARLELTALLGEIAEVATALARARGVEVRISERQTAVWAQADAMLARQAVLAALSWLVAGRPDWIVVSCSSDQRQATIKLASGPTLSDVPQAMSAERRQLLATTAELMRAQGGSLQVVESAGKVQELQLLFPQPYGARVLLVDDNEQVLQLFERYLSAEGYAVTCASGGEAALRAIEVERPQIIVLDVMMRGVDGWQLLQRLRADPALQHVPVVVCSVLDEPDLARALGAQQVLKKPVRQQDMLAAVRAALAGDQAE
jgi:CheY-like chemotaxis protein